ncbi:hypothetical protein [Psychroserpens luteus]|uniref:Uncharacterized protein n=1 Tax=Psychroserpens luteus TaxID=1434066 RepID=A0ABW5ZUX7_9FLAO|nr:hypothetical protein [Psychroserpens luteus]
MKESFLKKFTIWHKLITFFVAIIVLFFLVKDKMFPSEPIISSPQTEKGNATEIGNGNKIDSFSIKNISKEGKNEVKIGDDNEIKGLEIEQEN